MATTPDGDRAMPTSLPDLLKALTDFSELEPAERAAVAPALADAARSLLAAERRQAMAEATDRTRLGWITQRDLARKLGINHNKVWLAVAQFRREHAG